MYNKDKLQKGITIMKKALYRLETYYKQKATESERDVLVFLLNQTREAVEIDIHSLAKKCYCSPATIVRICKKNGFKGFKDLKLALQNDLNFSQELEQANIQPSSTENLQATIVNALNENIHAIQNTFSLLDFQELNTVVDLIARCHYVYLFGIGASFLVARDLQQKLERINKKTILYEDIHLQLVSSTNIEKDEVAIVFSYSGLTKEIIEMAHNIKAHGGIIIAVTKYGSSKLISLSDYNLYVPRIEAPLRISASSSRISQLSVVDILYQAYLARVHNQSMDKIIATNKLLEKKEEE